MSNTIIAVLFVIVFIAIFVSMRIKIKKKDVIKLKNTDGFIQGVTVTNEPLAGMGEGIQLSSEETNDIISTTSDVADRYVNINGRFTEVVFSPFTNNEFCEVLFKHTRLPCEEEKIKRHLQNKLDAFLFITHIAFERTLEPYEYGVRIWFKRRGSKVLEDSVIGVINPA